MCEAPGGADDDPLERVTSFQAACAAEAAVHGGVALQQGGATFVACFGYPVAHEDATRQAARAGLAVCRRLGDAVVAAVSTGPAVITERPDGPPVVVGDATAVATALVAQAAPGGVTVTATTFRLIDGFFECEPAGEVRPRRAPEAVPVYRVRAERAVRNRMEALDPARLSPLIGRDREVDLLKERWALAAEGVRGVILLVADPGLGKSRLVRVLREHALRSPGDDPPDSGSGGPVPRTVVEWYCSRTTRPARSTR